MEDNNLDALFADWKQCMYCLPNDFSWNKRSERVNCLWGGNVADLEEEEKFHTQNPCQYYWHIHNTSTNHDIVQFISQDTTVETLVLFSFNLTQMRLLSIQQMKSWETSWQNEKLYQLRTSAEWLKRTMVFLNELLQFSWTGNYTWYETKLSAIQPDTNIRQKWKCSRKYWDLGIFYWIFFKIINCNCIYINQLNR